MKHFNSKKLTRTFIAMLAISALTMALAMVSFAEGDPTAVAATMGNSNLGLGLIAAALSTGIAGIGAGIAVGAGAPAAIGALTEDAKTFGKALIFVVLGEGIALYGMLVSILILNKL